jgi:Bacterial CdiA-CT RNAse A domain
VKKRLTRAWIVSAIATLLCLVALYAVGCGSAPTLSNGGAERSSPGQTAGAAKAVPARYDLGRDEESGGHTLSRHVARTDAELDERLERERNISAASTWTDRETAEETVAEALHAERGRGRVESWMRRGYPRANLALHYSTGRPIGRSLRRGESAPVTCTDAVIVLRADGPDSFYVLTAYPETRR